MRHARDRVRRKAGVRSAAVGERKVSVPFAAEEVIQVDAADRYRDHIRAARLVAALHSGKAAVLPCTHDKSRAELAIGDF